jgi:hypothetical protein
VSMPQNIEEWVGRRKEVPSGEGAWAGRTVPDDDESLIFLPFRRTNQGADRQAVYERAGERGRNGKRRKDSSFSGQITGAPSRNPPLSRFTSPRHRAEAEHLSPRAAEDDHASAGFSSIKRTRACHLEGQREAAKGKAATFARGRRSRQECTEQAVRYLRKPKHRALDPRSRARQISRPCCRARDR